MDKSDIFSYGYITILLIFENTKRHPLGGTILPHLHRYSPLPVKNYSFTDCVLPLRQDLL